MKHSMNTDASFDMGYISDEIIALFKAEMPTEEEMIAFANFFHKHKKAIERGECPKRPDELLKEFSNRMKGGKK